MAKAVLDIAVEIAYLERLAIDELCQEWRRLHQTPPPKRLSRDILLRGITYKLQENAFGGLAKATLRKLQGSSASTLSSADKRRPRVAFKPGTRLVREWHRQTTLLSFWQTVLNGAASAIARCRSSRVRSQARTGRDPGSSD